jgi:hypothetical protein
MTANNAIEGTNNVSIGFHYVATDAGGNPLDTYWLGIPDYLADSNGALGAWEMCYFGHLGLDPNASDGQGHTLLYDYQNGLEPTNISFQISFTNQYVNLTHAPLSLAIQSGVPYYWAVLLDNTNFAGASWTAYTSSNITANLGTVQGWHTVWVGLSRQPAGAQQVWNAVRLDLDLTAPVLTVTNALNVTIPMIQLQGYANEELAWLTYDLNNANGSISNQQALITGQFYDTNSSEVTTNYFQCYDVMLASGSNAVTLHAADLAGNAATLTTSIVYLPSTNLPAVVLLWPQNGMQISGGNLTIQGQVSDPTATVAVTVSDTNGDTAAFSGLVGRDGTFWLENVSLYPGINSLALTLNDAVGSTTTNFTVIQSTVGLSVNGVQAGDTTVVGTMDTAGYTIWVNGVQASQSNGLWIAQIAAVGAGGGMVEVTAIPDSDNNGNGTGSGGSGNPMSANSINVQATVPPAQGVYVSSYHRNDQTHYNLSQLDQNLNTVWYNENWYDIMNWQNGPGGSENTFLYEDWLLWWPALYNITWPADSWPQSLPQGSQMFTLWYDATNSPPTITTNLSVASPPVLPQEHCAIVQNIDTNGSVEQRTADAEVNLATGGPLGSTCQHLWLIMANATDVATGLPIPYDQILIGAYGRLGTDGILYEVLADNAQDSITAKVPGNARFTWITGAAQPSPFITAGSIDLQASTPAFCVGQNVPFTLNVPSGVTATNVQWSLGGTFVNAHTNAVPGGSEPNGSEVYFMNANLLKYQTVTNCWWISGGGNAPATYQASVSFTMIFTNGEPPLSGQANGTFTMYRPTLTNWTQIGVHPRSSCLE